MHTSSIHAERNKRRGVYLNVYGNPKLFQYHWWRWWLFDLLPIFPQGEKPGTEEHPTECERDSESEGKVADASSGHAMAASAEDVNVEYIVAVPNARAEQLAQVGEDV